MNNYFSVLSGWMIPISRALEAWDINMQEVIEQCDLKPEEFKDPESRLAAEKMSQVIEYCNKAKGRDDFSIAVAQQFHPGMFHALGYAMMSSDSLKDAFCRIAQYKRVVSNTCTLSIETRGEEVYFVMDVASYEGSHRSVLSPDSILCFLATMVQFTRETLKNEYSPLVLRVSWPKPNYDISPLTDFFNCELIFGSDEISMAYDDFTLSKHLPGGNPLIMQTHEKILNEYLSRIDKDDVEQLVKNRIYEMLPLGTPSQTEIASHLAMSLRNLQRKLNEKNTSFRDILENTRKSLALEYIQQHHLSFSEIGYLVGFSNIGNFNRAFKRWTGSTPGVYRKENPSFVIPSPDCQINITP